MSSVTERSRDQITDLASQGFNLTEIARKTGISRSSARKVLGSSWKGKRGRPALDGPLSSYHYEVGLRVSGHFVTAVSEHDLEHRAAFFGWSTTKQGRIERGTWNLSLFDLVTISQKLKVSISDLTGEKTWKPQS